MTRMTDWLTKTGRWIVHYEWRGVIGATLGIGSTVFLAIVAATALGMPPPQLGRTTTIGYVLAWIGAIVGWYRGPRCTGRGSFLCGICMIALSGVVAGLYYRLPQTQVVSPFWIPSVLLSLYGISFACVYVLLRIAWEIVRRSD